MSQTKKFLKEIASSPQYEALAVAVPKADYEAMFASYVRLLELIERGRKKIIEEGIDSLPHRNKEEAKQKFRRSFDLATSNILPLWYQINCKLMEKSIMEGEISGYGSKGDPLVKTPEGRVVILSGAKLKEGERVKFQVIRKGERLDFGRALEFTPSFFYSLLTVEVREKIDSSLKSVEERSKDFLKNLSQGDLAELEGLLKEWKDLEELTAPLQGEQKERIAQRVLQYRKRLLNTVAISLTLVFLSQQEEQEMADFYGDNQEQKAQALLALGLFRHHTYEAVKGELLSGDKLRRYQEMVAKLEENISSMDSAMELLEFKLGVKGAYPRAKRYLEKMDGLFQRLSAETSQVAESLAKQGINNPEDLRLALRNTFSGKTLLRELRQAFRSPEEFFTLREALAELRQKLGHLDSGSAEIAFLPYLRHKLSQAFGN